MCKGCKRILSSTKMWMLDFKYFFCRECVNKGKMNRFIKKLDDDLD